MDEVSLISQTVAKGSPECFWRRVEELGLRLKIELYYCIIDIQTCLPFSAHQIRKLRVTKTNDLQTFIIYLHVFMLSVW